MTTSRFLLPAACWLLLAVSCAQKNPVTPAAPPVKPKFLTSVVKDGIPIAQYVYNPDSTVRRMCIYHNVTGKLISFSDYANDTNGHPLAEIYKVASDTFNPKYYFMNYYTSFGSISTRRQYIGASDTMLYTYVYEYNSGRQMTRCSVYSDSATNDSTRLIYRYDNTYSGDDVVRVRYFNPADSTFDTLTYTRDAKNNPFAYLPSALYPESSHNPTSLSVGGVQLDTSGRFTMRFSGLTVSDTAYASSDFDYDADGWPLVARHHIQSFLPKTFTYQYQYLP